MPEPSALRIIRLVSENIKRVKAVDITPDPTQDVVTVGGRNRAGKSSVLDSIAMALGGKDLVPPEPIRQGEAEGRVEVDLGELVVTRKFKRDHGACNCGEGREADGEGHDPSCASRAWGEVKSTLTVKIKDSGAGYSSPQAMLDKLVGDLTFDPLAFTTLKPAEAATTLRKLVGIDTTVIEDLRKKAVMNRTAYKKQVDELTSQLAITPWHKGVAEQEVSLDEVSNEMAEAERLRKAYEEARRIAYGLDAQITQGERLVEDADKVIADLEKSLNVARERRRSAEEVLTTIRKAATDAKIAAETAATAVPDVDALRNRLREVEEHNKKARVNVKHHELSNKKSDASVRWDAENQVIAKLDADKTGLLANAKFPVPGLAVNDVGITLNGVPFEQASMSEQLEVSVAIGLALNPRLRVMLVRNGNALDDDSLKRLGELAEAADAQVWVEYVTSDPSDVAVMIEDGEVV